MADKGLFIVMAKITPEKEEAFNRWYNEVHIPEVLATGGGVLGARRYKIKAERTLLEGGKVNNDIEYQYMTIYEFEDYEKMDAHLNSGSLAHGVSEYNAAFGEGGRHHIRAVQVKSMVPPQKKAGRK